MRQTPEAEAFVNRIISLPKGPGVSLDAALQPSLDDEAELRKLFATDKTNARLADPLVGLVDIFDAPVDIRTTRARVVKDDQDLSSKYVMPLSDANRRKEGSPCTVQDLEEFQKNWLIFSEGSLSQLSDWNNVVAAGGSVLGCLTPLSDANKVSKRSIRKYYHSAAYPTSDVDLFLWGMNAEQAEKKIVQIYEAVRDSVPWDVTCVRTKHTVSIHSQYPYRSVQIVLRLYNSPAEILAGFDIDAPCCLYNGQRVLANPRSIVALMRQANTVDMTRRSPSYEVRLSKYSGRGFEVYVPSLRRDDVDPTIYERSIARIEGMARLLVLEKLTDTDIRYNFLESRRTLRGRPNPLNRYKKRKNKYKGDLKVESSLGGLEMNDYDVTTLHIPYGPGWDARRIDKLVYQTDLGMNSTFNPKNKNRRLHRHPAFFGTMEECLDDCCEHCPEPIDADERALQEEEDKNQIRGRIAFIEEDPGRQTLSGSFNPIDVGEWSAQVYIGDMEHFFAAIVSQDREGVTKMLQNGIDVNRRDHVGRTALHVAILTGGADIACDLINAGAMISARLVDGRSALHMAAQYNQPAVLSKLLEKSASNKAAAAAAQTTQEASADEKMDVDNPAAERPSSEDDWTSGDDGVIAMDTDMEDTDSDKADDGDEDGEGEDDEDGDDEGEGEDDDGNGRKRKKAEDTKEEEATDEAQEFPEDSPDKPDVLEINLPDWDLGFTPLAHAVLSGSLETIELLLKEGADVTLSGTARDTAFHPITLTILKTDEDKACEILERLIAAGATTSTADDSLRTIFHRAVIADKVKLVSTILRCDPNAALVLNFPLLSWGAVRYPVVTAIHKRHYSMLATLLAHGVRIVFKEEDVTRSIETVPPSKQRNVFPSGLHTAVDLVYMPLETALAKNDDVAQLLIAVGVDVDVALRSSLGEYVSAESRKTIVDYVRSGIPFLSKKIATLAVSPDPMEGVDAAVDSSATGWKKFYPEYVGKNKLLSNTMKAEQQVKRRDEELKKYQDAHSFLIDVERLLTAKGAKTWNDIYPEKPCILLNSDENQGDSTVPPAAYVFLNNYYFRQTFVPHHTVEQYEELFDACFTGNNKRIEELCLPQEGTGNTTIPLNIFVQVAIIQDEDNRYAQTGHTPLFAAIMGRQWTTAKLIMAIAIAQYQPSEKEKKFVTDNINIYDDDSGSDTGSEDSDDSSDTVDAEGIKFIDVAKRPSSVETDVHPKRILDAAKITWIVKNDDGKYESRNGNMLSWAIYNNDLEVFRVVLNLYLASPLKIDMEHDYLEEILRNDKADLLDEYIRKTGQGIEIQHDQTDQEVVALNDKNKLYLGLSVHGKKRADLATKRDPNALPSNNAYPLVWQAITAKSTIEYLAGDRPLAAYKHYASTGGDERAFQLRRVTNLEKVLPQWLGWTISSVGDSPLTAAILGKDLDVIKILFDKKPKFMASCLHETIKFYGYNAILLSVDPRCKLEITEYLLAKSVSPVISDSIRGWNIYHILCNNNGVDAVQYFLQKLPRDVNEALLTQPSKGRLNTPLHLAVKRSAKGIVKLLIDYTKSSLLTRDIDGSTPLHCAVQGGCGEITELLIQASPREAIYMENGVGETPLDMANLKYTLELTQKFTNEHYNNAETLSYSHPSEYPVRVDLNGLDPELKRLRDTIEWLIKDGKLDRSSTLAEELTRFADLMDSKVTTEKAIQAAKPVEDVSNVARDTLDAKRTLDAVSTAIAENPGKRLLVHLIDVQKSVQGNLEKYLKLGNTKEEHDDGEGLGVEEDTETKEKNKSMVLSRLSIRPDDF